MLSILSQCVGDRATSLAAFNADTREGRRGKARMLSVDNSPALAWATAVPGATHNSNANFILARRYTLRLAVPLQVEMQPCLCGAGNVERLDLAMACNQIRGKATLRHDLWIRPGIVPSVEQVAHTTQSRPTAVLQHITVATLPCGMAASSQLCLVAASQSWTVLSHTLLPCSTSQVLYRLQALQ